MMNTKVNPFRQTTKLHSKRLKIANQIQIINFLMHQQSQKLILKFEESDTGISFFIEENGHRLGEMMGPGTIIIKHIDLSTVLNRTISF